MTESDAKLLHRVERNLFIDGLRHAKTKQGRFDAAMWHLDHPVPGTDVYLKPSDHGAGAERLYAALEGSPLWQKLFLNAYLKLKPTGKKVFQALKQDWRSRTAAKIAGVDHKTIDRWKTFFKVDFAQCFRAYKANLA